MIKNIIKKLILNRKQILKKLWNACCNWIPNNRSLDIEIFHLD